MTTRMEIKIYSRATLPFEMHSHIGVAHFVAMYATLPIFVIFFFFVQRNKIQNASERGERCRFLISTQCLCDSHVVAQIEHGVNVK